MVAWGSITGTLGNQVDLKNALDGKAAAQGNAIQGVKESQGNRNATIALNSGATNAFYSWVAVRRQLPSESLRLVPPLRR